MSLIVKEAGLLMTLQDQGRKGISHLGLSSSGALDEESYRLANLLVGNKEDEAVIEMMAKGGQFVFKEKAVVALTGANCQPKLNGRPLSLYHSYRIEPGDELICGAMTDGMCTYLSVHGGFKDREIMGSQSAHTKVGIGKVLKKEEMLSFPLSEELPEARKLKIKKRKRKTIRVIEGPQSDVFSQEEKEIFYQSRYTVGSQSDRMGYRLNGRSLKPSTSESMLSEGTVLGGIQVPYNGQPIVLLQDRQTTGGYPVIAVVATVDLSTFVQKHPGSEVQFEKVTLEEAQNALQEREKWFSDLKEQWDTKDFYGTLEEEKISELIQVFEQSSLRNFYYQDEEVTLKLDKGALEHDDN